MIIAVSIYLERVLCENPFFFKREVTRSAIGPGIFYFFLEIEISG
jgi:hypothetical protein